MEQSDGVVMPWPKASEVQVAKLDKNMEGRAERRKMFGHPCYFLKGNMIAGVFGDKVFLRLPASTMEEMKSSGRAEPFVPMPGRPMSAYVQMDDATPALFQEALRFAETLPEKAAKKKR